MKKFKYIMSLFVVTSLLAQATFANTQMVNKEISREYARLDYQLGTIWNQIDPTFKENATKVFSENLGRIQRKNGLTNDQVIEAVMKESNLGPMAISELKSFVKYAKENGVSDKEKNEFVANILKNSQSTGASFDSTGETMIYALILLVTLVSLVYIESIMGGGVWECTAYNSYSSYTSTGSSRVRAEDNALDFCYDYTSYYDYCDIGSCRRL